MIRNVRFLSTIVFVGLVLLTLYTRLYGLSISPPSLYWEEVALGYDAYSILKTGADHHGNLFPIVAVESFGDWKPSGYFYALIPFIAVFGLEEWVVRIPAALAGITLVFAVAALARKYGLSYYLGFAVAAISPWAIHFSRAGWEVMLATALLTWGVVLLWPGKERLSMRLALAASLLFVAAAYTYHATRIISPVLICLLLSTRLITSSESLGSWAQSLKKNWRRERRGLVTAAATFILLYTPLVVSIATTPDLQRRYAETGNILDIAVIEQSNELKERAGNTLLARILYHRYVLWGISYSEKIAAHFTLDYLAITGDENLRHGTQYFGTIYPLDVIFLVVGVVLVLRRRRTGDVLLLTWLILTVAIAALARPVPHALRTLPAIAPQLLLIALGISVSSAYIVRILKQHRYIPVVLALVLVAIYCFQATIFWKYSLTVYPTLSVGDWRYGYKEAITALAAAQKQHPELETYVTREWGRPAMYYWFFTQTDPRAVQAAAAVVRKDQGEFIEFENMQFGRSVNEVPERSILLLASGGETQRYLERVEKAGHSTRNLATIRDLQNVVVWELTLVE